MRNIYIAYTIKNNGKYRSGVLKTTDSNNLISVLEGIPYIITANIWPKNKAYEIADAWNESYKNNGTLLSY